jgi:BirA family biotin operon repressor/biotin-[acetyl-CoA-carboxylase] ligase
LELLTTAAGVACAEAIEQAAGIDVGLRWPNDLTVDDRKLAGILVESRVGSGAVDVAVVGVGINVGSGGADLPAELAARATSIHSELGDPSEHSVGRIQLLARVLERMEARYVLLRDDEGARTIVEAASKRSVVLGRRVAVRLAGGSMIEGKAVELSRSGSLLIDRDGEVAEVTAGEVQRLGLA